MSNHQHTNRLIHETSPYLRQHAHNPVDWYPWGEEALARARAEDKPIFLSIGYSACHWCHVMEHESFEDEADRRADERAVRQHQGRPRGAPDLDAIYMDAVQAMTGQGGWPMSVWLTPEGKPFHGGTYYPKPAALRDAQLPAGAARRGRRLSQPARQGGRPGRAAHGDAAPHSIPGRRRRRSGRRHPGRGLAADAPIFRRRGRRFWQPAQVPPADDAGLRPQPAPAHRRPGRALDGRADAGEDGPRRHLRPTGRRLPPLQRGRHLARPPLREDALRQRATAAHLPPRLAGDGRARSSAGSWRRPSTTCCAR
jgi:hypothetical protein